MSNIKQTPRELAVFLCRIWAIDVGVRLDEAYPAFAAGRYGLAAESLTTALEAAEAFGWIAISRKPDPNDAAAPARLCVALSPAGYDVALMSSDPVPQPVGIGVFMSEDGEIVAVLVRHPDGSLVRVEIEAYALSPPAASLPEVPGLRESRQEHRTALSF